MPLFLAHLQNIGLNKTKGQIAPQFSKTIDVIQPKTRNLLVFDSSRIKNSLFCDKVRKQEFRFHEPSSP